MSERNGDLRVRQGEKLARGSRAGATVRVSPLMIQVLPRLRALLVDAARRRTTVTYREVTQSLEHAYLQQGLGPVLDVLAEDCSRRGEPRLDTLVVTVKQGEVGTGFEGDAVRERFEDNAVRERDACWSYWASRS